MKEYKLSDLLDHTRADGAIILTPEGQVIESLSIEKDKNVAAMLGVLITMCKDLSTDMGMGVFKQIVLKADEGVFIVDKIQQDDVIVGIYAKDVSRGGLIKLTMDNLNK